MSSSVSLEAMFVWQLFADGKLTLDSFPGNFVEQQSCFVACLTLTWALVIANDEQFQIV